MFDPLDTLQSFTARRPVKHPDDLEQETNKLLQERLESHALASHQASTVLSNLFRLTPKPNSLKAKVRRAAKNHALQLRNEAILDDSALQQIWHLLTEHATNSTAGDIRINYDGFTQVATKARALFGQQSSMHFKACAFLKFEPDAQGCISVPLFWQYIKERCGQLQLRVELSCYDEDGDGFMTNDQIEDYVRAMVPNVPALEHMAATFTMHYKRIAARKLIFFHGKNGGVRIRDLVTSPLMRELADLRDPVHSDQLLLANWFSLQSAQRVYNTFATYDEDMNGTLSPAEFSKLGQGGMSRFFISRVFEEHVRRRRGGRGAASEMDLLDFVDFVLAWDNRNDKAAIPYFMTIYDLGKQGCITPTDLYVFFKEVHEMWLRMGEDADLRIQDVVDEIIDMAQPKSPPNIRAEDLASSRMAGTIFAMLADVQQFYMHNYRETLMQQDDSH